VQLGCCRRLNNGTFFATLVCSGCRLAGIHDIGTFILRISARADVPIGDPLYICRVLALGWTVEQILVQTKATSAPSDASVVECAI
jgi:hypothetical protein